MQATLTLVIGLIGFVAGLVIIYLQFQYTAEENAFRTAAACDTPQTATMSQSCTYTGQVTVAGSHRSVRLIVDMTFTSIPGRTFTTSFSTQREPAPETVNAGATETAQLWDGKVTKFAGVGTVDDPDYLPTNSIPGALVFVAVGLGISIWSTVMVRRAWRP